MSSPAIDKSYTRQNTVQINKIRTYIRKRGYLSTLTLENTHIHIDGKNVLIRTQLISDFISITEKITKLLKIAYHGMIFAFKTTKNPADSIYKDLQVLEFSIKVPLNHYMNWNGMHI